MSARTFNSVNVPADGIAHVRRGKRQRYVGTFVRNRLGWTDIGVHVTNGRIFRDLDDAIAYKLAELRD